MIKIPNKILKTAFIFASIFFLSACQTGKGSFKTNLKKKSLPNGVEVLSFKDKGLPFFKVILWSPKGSAYEPKDSLGVTNLVANLLIEGAGGKSKKELIDAFSRMGSGFSAYVSDDQTVFSAESLTEDSLNLVQLFSKVVLQPKFDNKAILNLKGKTIAEIKQIEDSPSSLSQLGFAQVMYKGHGYSRMSSGTLDSISGIRRDSIVKRYRQVIEPKDLKLILVGNWTEGAEAFLLSEIADLEKDVDQEMSLDRIETPEKLAESIIFHKGDLKQANVSFGISSIARKAVDYEALKTGLFILGGSFKSRLNKELRVKRGLTYGVGAGVDAAYDGGLIRISGGVRHDKVYEFITEAKKILRDTIDQGVTSEELAKAKAYISGQFPRGVETKDKEASVYMDLVSRGVEGEELYRYLDKVKNLSLDQVNDALRKHLVLSRLNTVVLANRYKIPTKHVKALKLKMKSYKKIKL